MSQNDSNGSGRFKGLRRRAEKILQNSEWNPSSSSGEMFELLHELQVYQSELEVQNEELRSAQQELSNLHREYEDLYEFAPCGYLTLDSQGVITRCNQIGASLLGGASSSLHYRALSSFVSQQSQSAYLAALKRAGHTGEQQSEELKLIRQNKTPLWARVDVLADRAKDGGVQQWRLSFLDITDRVMTQHQLQESKRELAAIYENAPLVILVVDRNFEVRKGNRFTSRFLGIAVSDMIHKQLGDVLSCGHCREDPRGCGYGFQCEHCTVRNALLHTFETGRNTDQAEGSLHLRKSGQEREMNFLVSSSLFYHSDQSRALLTIVDITERVRAENKLRYISFHDSLTGLYNRNFFQEEMNRLQSDRCESMGIVLCDLDGMKFINDAMGHAKGDEIIKRAAELLQENFRSSDIVARIGGDEFAVFIPGVDIEGAERLVRRLGTSTEKNNRECPEIPISLSMGYAVHWGNPVDMEALYRQADNRMYRNKLQREPRARSMIVKTLTRAMEARDFMAQGHCERLQKLMDPLARAMGLSEEFINNLYLLARYHDVGKVAVPDRILFKRGSLSSGEMQEVRQHSEVGSRIALAVPELAGIADWILKHHERWDGTGYPLGLSGDDIPLACRILGLAEAYDAMVTDRPNGKATSIEGAIMQIRQNAGYQFDPVLAEKFISVLRQSV